MEFMEVVKKRRSIRAFLPEPIEKDKLTFILEAARLAPSWKNLQCWRFMVVTSELKRAEVACSVPEASPANSALLQAPVNIVLCADPTESAVYDGKDYCMLDAGLAMEHLVLAAADQGLGTCWLGIFDQVKVREALNIPPQIRILAITPLGYPGQERNPRPRKSIAEIAYSETWGQSWEG